MFRHFAKFIRYTTTDATEKFRFVNNLLLFDGCSDNKNLVLFKDVNEQMNIFARPRGKRAKLVNKNENYNKGIKDFKDFLAMDLYKRIESTKREFANHKVDFDIQVNIKIGFKYFESKLLRWNQLITVQELLDLLEKNKITLSNSKYYHKPRYEAKSRDALRTKFNDHGKIDDVFHLITYLTSIGYYKENELTTYRVIGIKKQLVQRLLQESNADADLVDLIEQAKSITLKFYDNFMLKQIEIYNYNNSNVDVLCEEFDVRVQLKTMHYLNREVCDRFEQFEKAFNGFISDINNTSIKINCDSNEVNFLRKCNIKYYVVAQGTHKNPSFSFKLINFSEYLTSTSRKGCMLMEPKAEIENHIRMKTPIGELLRAYSSDSLEKFKNEEFNHLFEEIYQKSIWLSNIASKFKF